MRDRMREGSGRGRSHVWFAAALGLVLVAAGAGLLWAVVSSQPQFAGTTGATDEPRSSGEVPVRDFADYSWGELKAIATKVAQAPDDAARALAASYNVSVGAVHELELADGHTVGATVVGIRADAGSGITLMAGPVAVRAMNDEATNAGGWEGSALRAWLGQEGAGLLPKELTQVIVPVTKLTNNAGVSSDASAVTQTTDALWLFSASEVCGTLDWFTSEYGSTPVAGTGYTDFAAYDGLISAEGSQYEYFAGRGVGPTTDPEGALGLQYAGQEVAWWYRTPYPYSFAGDDASYYYQVMAGGYPDSVGRANEAAGVVVGFCL